MQNNTIRHKTLTDSVESLSCIESLQTLFDRDTQVFRMPSEKTLAEIIDLMRDVMFPYHYGETPVYGDTLKYYIGVRVDRMARLLREQVKIALGYERKLERPALKEKANDITQKFVAALPELRRLLTTDVVAAYEGDPAAKNHGEIISCYPVIKALTNYRMAHELLQLGVPLIPRMLTEMAHSETGIDIHPGAQIGESFTIDHGTGVVIGETCIIGRHVKLYQGVTLGARSFPLDEEGKPIKGIPRHPILEDDVIVYSNATILGRITIGRGATVGGNIWVTQDVPAGCRVVQQKASQEIQK
ncbi:MAG: serine acetyltransferase [Bacteroidaceae bacterium]|nr:serine acetyltransferase [Bacteroidaceae bacterium]MDO4993672.1 serine acetyltransferase [Bacteroidales bacterium]